MTGPALVGLALGWAAAGRPKAQGIRLLDVWVLGPLLLYAATSAADKGVRTALGVAAGATIAYNGRNYLARVDTMPYDGRA